MSKAQQRAQQGEAHLNNGLRRQNLKDMQSPSEGSFRRVPFFLWALLVLSLVVIAAMFFIQRGPRKSGTPTESKGELPVYGRLGGFRLTNQFDALVRDKDLAGRPLLVDIIFTRCAGPCLRMTQVMSKVEEQLAADHPLRFLSLTADPAHDQPDVLKRFAQRFGADGERWWFLTGEKQVIYDLAQKDLKLTVVEEKKEKVPVEDQFIHSTKFALIDAKGRVRGYFEGDDPSVVEEVIQAIHLL